MSDNEIIKELVRNLEYMLAEGFIAVTWEGAVGDWSQAHIRYRTEEEIAAEIEALN